MEVISKLYTQIVEPTTDTHTFPIVSFGDPQCIDSEGRTINDKDPKLMPLHVIRKPIDGKTPIPTET